MKVVLYGVHGCPMCSTLGSLLKKKNIDFEKNEDTEAMIKMGFNSIPVLELADGTRLEYSEAIRYINTLG